MPSQDRNHRIVPGRQVDGYIGVAIKADIPKVDGRESMRRPFALPELAGDDRTRPAFLGRSVAGMSAVVID
jgi:hypothetical protein